MSTEKLTFSTTIDAPPEVIWRVLWDDVTYREWTAVFAEGSYAVTDWKEGSKVLFLTPAGDGLVSRIAVNRPNEYLSIEHLGFVKAGVEDTDAAKKEGWAGAHENYTLQPESGGAHLTIDMDATPGMIPYFSETWPKALAKLKALCEARQ